jgi:SulP family sulfate permease
VTSRAASPRRTCPTSASSATVVAAAVSVAVIVLVQGAGVAESVPNPDGSTADTNGDFAAQGWANLASGLVRGVPVGGSVGNTALNLTAGARTRWAAISSGAWILLVLVLFGGVVGLVALPPLAAVLIYAGVGSIKPVEIRTIMRTAPGSRLAPTTTFLATPVPADRGGGRDRRGTVPAVAAAHRGDGPGRRRAGA